jgi:serine/threonine protein kinase
MDIYCTRPLCPTPINSFVDLDSSEGKEQQKYCTCGIPLILNSHYIPLKRLSQKGFGFTFLACDTIEKEKKYIIKQLLTRPIIDFVQLKSIKESFQKEAEALQNLSKQNSQIPELVDFFEFPPQEQGYFYLVQEYLEGQNLQEELDSKGKFYEAQVLDVLLEILPVLKFIHGEGSIHRDIKPSNIIRGNNQLFYLVDFGTVKQVTFGVPTNKSIIFATDDFASPEQKSGNELFPSSDLYSLAVTCICLLTGKKATELYDNENKSWNWKNYALTSDRLANILDRMLIDEPNQRFQSVTDVIRELKPSPIASTKIIPPPTTPTSTIVEPTPSVTKIEDSISQLLELLYKAAFTGFEGGLLVIAIASLLGTSLISAGFWVWMLILGALIFVQRRGIITHKNRWIIALITLTVILIVPALQTTMPIQSSLPKGLYVFLLAVFSGSLVLAFVACHRLIYKLIKSFI